VLTRTLAPFGTFTDVARVGGVWWSVFQEGDHLRLTMHAEDLSAVTAQAIPLGGAAAAFPKLYAWGGALYLAYRDGAEPYHGHLLQVGTENIRDLGVVYNSDPVVMGEGWIAWQATGDPQYAILKQAISGGFIASAGFGHGTGLSRIVGGQVITVDDDRSAVPGYTRPCWAGDAVAVEGQDASGPFDLVRRTDGFEVRVFPGQLSDTPRIAADEDGRYLLGTWGDSPRLALIEPSDFRAPAPPVTPPPPTPEPDMLQPPGVTIDHWDPTLSGRGDWTLQYHNRNAATGVAETHTVTFHNGNLRVRITNAAGTDISGEVSRHVNITP
jgi:hypothetical protein